MKTRLGPVGWTGTGVRMVIRNLRLVGTLRSYRIGGRGAGEGGC